MKTNEVRESSFSELLGKLLSYLEDKSYSQNTLNGYRYTLMKIQTYMHEHNIEVYTPEVGQKYSENYLAKNKFGISRQKALHTAIRRLNDFHSGMEFTIQQKNLIESLSKDYERIVDRFIAQCTEIGNKVNTLKSKKSFLRRFLKNCISCECQSIHSLNPSVVVKACLMVENKDAWAVIRAFLKFLSTSGTIESDFSTLVPRYRRPINIPVTYTAEEIIRFEEAIDRTKAIGKRDYAMLLLSTRLGMRSGDIVKLTLNELDFKNNKIDFIQQKTGESLQLPMIPEIKGALIDYIDNVRPKVDRDTVFLRKNAPHLGITTSVIRFVTTKYFNQAGIDISGKKHGPHVFRSSLASSMINDNSTYEIVRRVMGHSDPNVIKRYAKLDIEKLRECAIEVPVPSGSFKVFLNGGVQV